MYVLFKMGYWSLRSGWMEIRFSLATYITVCICYPQVRLMECLPREIALHYTVCLLTNCCSDVNTTAKCWCILFECLGENVGLNSVVISKRFLKIRFSCPWRTHCVLYSLHMIVQIWQSSAIRPQECSQWQLSFHCRLHLLIRKYSWCIQ
jgi:hypothetical protein